MKNASPAAQAVLDALSIDVRSVSEASGVRLEAVLARHALAPASARSPYAEEIAPRAHSAYDNRAPASSSAQSFDAIARRVYADLNK